MSSRYGVTKDNLLASLPVALRQDKSMLALADSLADMLAARPEEISRTLIYPRIDQLDEGLLDILAYDFKVDWWDADYSLDEKRRTLKSSWSVHKTLGTKAAVETALRAVYENAKVVEWFEYGGEPYHFRLDLDVRDGSFDPIKHRQVMQRVAFYKNLRSWLDAVAYEMPVIVFPEPGGGLRLKIFSAVYRFVSYGGGVILLNGERTLDGSWLLNQAFQELKWKQFRCGVSTQNTYRLTGTLTRDNMWQLDGLYNLDGTKKLNASITKEDI